MDTQITFLVSILVIFFLSTLSQFYCQEDGEYSICSRPYNCGNMTNISYPFFGENRQHFCGSDGFELECWNNQTTFIKIGENRFTVLDINQTAYTMRIRREELVHNDCEFTDASINASLFRYLSRDENLTIFTGCNSAYSIGLNNYTCPPQTAYRVFYVNETQLRQFSDLWIQCDYHFQVPVLRGIYLEPGGGLEALISALEKGFDVRYVAERSNCSVCMASKGICGSRRNNQSRFSCHCGDGTSQDIFCPIPSSTLSFLRLSLNNSACCAYQL